MLWCALQAGCIILRWQIIILRVLLLVRWEGELVLFLHQMVYMRGVVGFPRDAHLLQELLLVLNLHIHIRVQGPQEGLGMQLLHS